MSPLNVKVPSPALFKVPELVIIPEIVNVVSEGTVKVAALDKVIPLLEFNVKLPVVSKVPPFKVNLSASDVLGFPRLLSALILILPAFI